MNMKRFNGKYGCLYCYHPGVTYEGNHLHRFWPNRDVNIRTHESLCYDGKKAVADGEAVRLTLVRMKIQLYM